MKVSVAGTGYVGLVSGVCLAELGHNVICVDTDQDKVNQINRGEPPIYEEGLAALLQGNIGERLKASCDLQQAVLETELTLIAVGTPFDGDVIDLSYIKTVSEQIGQALAEKMDYHMVVVKSTVVPGTTDEVVLPILEKASGKIAGEDFGVGMNPEFLREGEAIKDFMHPDRIVLGGIDQRSISCLAELYRVFENVDKLETSCRTAEMIKYTANSLLATLISFSNEIGNLCAAIGGVDVKDVMAGVHLDRRLSPILENGERIIPSVTTYLEAGCGFGGSCFPKDVKALVAYGRAHNEPMQMLESVVTINESQPYKMMEILNRHFNNLDGVKVAVLGFAFKPGSDDMRESPAISIIRSILDQKGKVIAFDPVAKHEAVKLFPEDIVSYSESLNDAINQVDVIMIITRWPEFEALPHLLANSVNSPFVIDGRRMLDKHLIKSYAGIGL
jgi:UDPglucose 6-dehydrogenase/GDP-mannose 6-dehydrogenase